MRILLVGEDREGTLLRSLEEGFRDLKHAVTVVDPARATTTLVDSRGLGSRIRRMLSAKHAGDCLVEAVEQLRPEATLIVKGRGIDSASVAQARQISPVAIYYPDNPRWRRTDSRDALARLAEADLAVVWSDRIRSFLAPLCRRAAAVPFGYDHRWFPLTDPRMPRTGVVFVGTWHPRRERHLRALRGLPVTVVGTGWAQRQDVQASPPVYGSRAGLVLQRAAVGLNVLHPHNAGAHNMRTRELAASGALQLTDPGTDGTPLRDGDGCRWFHSPAHLRELVEHYLGRAHEAQELARRAQELVGHETYQLRAQQLAALLGEVG